MSVISKCTYVFALVFPLLCLVDISIAGFLDRWKKASVAKLDKVCIQEEDLKECRNVMNALCSEGNAWACKPGLGLVDLLASLNQQCRQEDRQACNRLNATRYLLSAEISCQNGDQKKCAELAQFRSQLQQPQAPQVSQQPQSSQAPRSAYQVPEEWSRYRSQMKLPALTGDLQDDYVQVMQECMGGIQAACQMEQVLQSLLQGSLQGSAPRNQSGGGCDSTGEMQCKNTCRAQMEQCNQRCDGFTSYTAKISCGNNCVDQMGRCFDECSRTYCP